MATWEFPCSEPIDANVAIAAGTVSVTAEPADVVTVSIRKGRSGEAGQDDDHDQLADEVSVDYSDHHLVVSELPRRGPVWRGKDLHVTITLPAGSRSAVHTASADVTCRGEYGAVDIRTASGRVSVDSVRGPAEISTMSGELRLAEAAEATLQTASGGIRMTRAAGDVTARTASGDIRIGTADASVTAQSASGGIRVLSISRGQAELNSVSGDIEVKVPKGTGVYLDLASVTGRVSSDLAPSGDGGEDLTLRCRTVSGSLRVARTAPAETAG